MHFQRLNVVSFEVFTGGKRTPLIGAHLPPFTLDNLPDLGEALTRFQNEYPIVVWDLNSNISYVHNPHSHQVADLLMEFGLTDLLHHFRKRWRFRHMKTWY